MTGMTVHVADVVLPITAEPIERGAVAVAEGDIVAVGTVADVRARHPEAPVTTWSGVLLPGLVNAHTHLQYTSFRDVGVEPYTDYTAWSVRFVDEYDLRSGEAWDTVARHGIELMLESGITCIADVVTDFVARDVMYDLGIPGVTYLELIGVDARDWARGTGDALRAAVVGAPTSDVTRVGISPHAPYSIDGPALTRMAELADELGVRLHIHVGESDGEDEFYRTGTGALADRVRAVTTRKVTILEEGGTGMGTGEYVASLGALGPNCHIAHGVYLGLDGRRIMRDHDTLVALCPRSNLTVGIDPPPVADYLHEGVPFAVGTDSLGSTPSLDLMADVALLRRLAVDGGYRAADLDRRLLTAATMGGARAVGLDDRLGSLEPGKRADLAVFDLAGDPPTSADAERRLVEHGAGRCAATLIAGVERYRSSVG